MRHAFLAVSLLAASLVTQTTGFAQTPPRDTSAEPKKGTAVIRGRVVAADTGAPIRGAAVSIRSSELKEPRSATTDAEGRYEIAELPAGRFILMVSPSTYKRMYLGTAEPFGTGPRGRLLDLLDGQVLKDVDFSLNRAGAINGRVVDEFGELMAGVRVSVLANVPGRPQMPFGGASSDDLGRFRIFGLAPGEYILQAEAGSPSGFAGPDRAAENYVTTYYPSTTNLAETPPVKLESAQELTDLEIRMVRSRTFRVTGLVLDSQGRPAPGAFVSLAYGTPGGFGRIGSGVAKPDGTFEFTKVAPGDYVVSARPQAGSEGPEASRPVKVSVGSADVENITLAMEPGATLAGHIVTDDGSVPAFKPTALRIMGSTIDRSAIGFGPTPSGAIAEDWTFELTGVRAPIILRLTGRPPEGWRLRTVTYRGADITDTPTDFTENTSARELEIVIGRRGAKIEGVALDAAGRPAPELTVLLLAAERERRFLGSTRTRMAGTDELGRFKLEGVPAGSYYLVATERLTIGPVSESTVFDPLLRLATRITVGEDEQKTINLPVTKLER